MDQLPADFVAQLMNTFKIEAEEHLKNLSDGLLALEGDLSAEAYQDTIETIFREAHSLKGAARAVDFIKIQDICQSMENVLSRLQHKKLSFSPELFDLLYATIDVVSKGIQNPDSLDAGHLKELAEKLNKGANKPNEEKEQLSSNATSKEATQVPAEQPDISTSKTIRVSTNKLDTLMQEVEETLVFKTIIGQRFQTLMEALKQISIWEKDWVRTGKEIRDLRKLKESGTYSFHTEELLNFLERQPLQVREFKENLQSLANMTAQDLRLTSSMVDGLLEDTKKVLMQPFSSLFDVFPRMVRDLSHSLNKKVNIVMSGGEIEVDRRILEEMKDPLIHLIRNSIDHGLETSEERRQKNKSMEGEIRLSATQKSGNSVEILLSDNGKGINVQTVKDSAVKSGLITQAESTVLSYQEALMLIFKSGLSTSPIITELSGRGLGLRIVLEKVEKLGGQLNVESSSKGTEFKITIPLTLATFRGVHIVEDGQDFIFPTHNLLRVLRITEEDIQTAEGKDTLNLDGRILSYVRLRDLLNLKDSQKKKNRKHTYAIIFKALDTTVAIGIDEVLNEQQIFVKGLGKQLSHVKNIAAATVMEWGKVVSILDPFDLIKSVSQYSSKTWVQSPEHMPEKKKRILIAEDSVTARVLIKNILESAGFEVKAAVDGSEALFFIKTEDFDLLLSDVEMPRMDGFELTETIRSIEKFKSLPIVLCTSRGSREDREHGIEVGANAYINKNDFNQSYLLEIISNFL